MCQHIRNKTTVKVQVATRACNGEFRSTYPTYHLMMDGGVLCNNCVESEKDLILDATRNPGTNEQWQFVTTQANFEDNQLFCDHCGKRIASSYMEDELTEEEQNDCVW